MLYLFSEAVFVYFFYTCILLLGKALILDGDFIISKKKKKTQQLNNIAYIAITDLPISLCFVLVPMFTLSTGKKLQYHKVLITGVIPEGKHETLVY